jgi:hypothetical protein
MLDAAGFTQVLWDDDSKAAFDCLLASTNQPAPSPSAPKVLNLPQVIGPQVRPKLVNMARNLEQGRTRVIRAIFRKA